MKKAGRLAAAVFAAMLLVTGCGAPAEKKPWRQHRNKVQKLNRKKRQKI